MLVLAFVSVLLIADTSNSPFAAQAAATPGSPEEREGLAAGIMHTEVFPLMLFAVGGMMLFPASNDLLTMFVALEVLSLPLYLLCGLARRRRLLSQEAAMKYFLLGRVLLGLLPVRHRAALRLRRLGAALRDRLGGGQQHLQRDRCCSPASRCSASGCCSRSARRRSTPGRPTSTRARRRRSPRSWRPAPRWPPSARCCGCSTWRSAPELGLAPGDVGRRDPDHGGRRHPRHHPDRREAAARLLLDRARRVHPDRRSSRSASPGLSSTPVLPGLLRLHHGRRVRRRHPGPGRGRGGQRTCPGGRASAAGRRWWRASSRCSCWPSPASR